MDGGGGGGADGFGSAAVPFTWHDFLERMRQPSAAEFVKSIKSFIVRFTNRDPDPEMDSAAVQDFLATMEVAFRAHTLWAGSSEEQLESAGEGLEKYVMTKLFSRVFASVPEDVRSDDELFEKMALLQQFVRPEYLDIKPEFQNETAWLFAQKELQKINMYKAPRDKLVCILNCCKVINNILLNASLASKDNPPGADEFLPVLIYVTIKANPPQLHSNLQYIQRYRRQSRLVSEASYYFTNILSAVNFIWNADAEALSMNEVEFQKKMESAREHLSGVPSRPQLLSAEMLRANRYSFGNFSQKEHQFQSHQVDPTGKSEVKDKADVGVGSISELEKKGSLELLEEDAPDHYFLEYPFLFACAGDLNVGDVEELLNSYKKLVLRYVSLSKGMRIGAPAHDVHETVVQEEATKTNANCVVTCGAGETSNEILQSEMSLADAEENASTGPQALEEKAEKVSLEQSCAHCRT